MNLRRLAVSLAALVAMGAHAAPIDWNTWNSTTDGTIATSSGNVTVTFAGNPISRQVGYPSWTPATTWADGVVVNNAPSASNNIIQLFGGSSALQTLTFSQAVVNPIFTIWSLGQGGINASFNFLNATPVFVDGGPSAEYGGNPIVVSGNNVTGVEGNGTVQFLGTYTSLSWTNPVFENWYGFNVGITSVAVAPIPEPETYALMLAGLGALGWMGRRRRA